MDDGRSGLTADLAASFYELALGAASWDEIGPRLERVLRGRSSLFWLLDQEGRALTGSATTHLDAAGVADYVAHYHRLDPWAQRCAREPGVRARRGTDFISEAQLERSEWYVDYCRRLGVFHVVGALFPLDGPGGVHAAIALHRPRAADDFGAGSLRLLDMLLPHLQRALQVGHRLGAEPGVRRAAAPSGLAALDALATAAFVLDAEGRVAFANLAAEGLARGGDGLHVLSSGPQVQARRPRTKLAASHAAETAALLALVRSAARGGAGGALGFRRPSGRPPLAVLVAPANRLPGAGGAARDAAIVFVSEPDSRSGLRAETLVRIFAMTRAEAEVAALLARGFTADQVATARGVSAATVRSQIRAVLAKTGSDDLRDLSRALGALGALWRG